MPEIKLKHVCSVSTEDPNHPADNLLSQETYRKWQSDAPGEKQAVVIIEFDKATTIHSVDIGNNGSAFIEVLVGKSTTGGGGSSSEGGAYEVLLVTSSFMSPAESKSWNNINRVRMFGKDKLSKTLAEQKWDRVKIVCTQPFNKTEKYGISFIKFHSPPLSVDVNETTPTKTTEQPTRIGIFGLKAEPTSSNNSNSSTLLFNKDGGHHKTIAAKARQASTELSLSSHKEDQSSSSSSNSSRKKPAPTAPKAPPTKVPKVEKETEKEEESPILFKELLKGVVFSLSGFQNPLRGNLRDKAIEMGAQYEPDWGPTCTHLICAFSNTPKYKEVKNKGGLIVNKQWLLDSYDEKKRQQAKRYRFTTDATEGEQYDKKEKQIFSKITYTRPTPSPKKEQIKNKTPPLDEKETTPTVEDPYGGSTDEGSDMETGPVKKREENDEEYDTEDEIERVRNEKQKPPKSSAHDKDLLDLPDFFSNCCFFLYGDFSSDDTRLLNRYIIAYKGCIENYMTDKVTHVITQQNWDENFDQALQDNQSLVFLKPQWIFACHSQRSLVAYDTFEIIKQNL